MIDIANERAQTYNLKDVSFSVEDATLVEFPEATFDVIYSRDTILHIADKLALFKQFCKWLKPGGTLMISDYCCTPNKWSKNYRLISLTQEFRMTIK